MTTRDGLLVSLIDFDIRVLHLEATCLKVGDGHGTTSGDGSVRRDPDYADPISLFVKVPESPLDVTHVEALLSGYGPYAPAELLELSPWCVGAEPHLCLWPTCTMGRRRLKRLWPLVTRA